MSRNVQLPMSFMMDVHRLILALEGFEMDSGTKMLCESIKEQIGAKIDAMDRRRTYTEYKTAAAGSPEREFRRQEYLDKVVLHPDWRTDQEQPYL